MSTWYNVTNQGSVPRIDILDEIGAYGISARQFIDDFKALPKARAIEVHIHSNGGSVFDGIAIYNTLAQSTVPVHIHIDGVAASIASLIAMAGTKRYMSEFGWLMIHNPSGVLAGDEDELAKGLDFVQKAKKQIAAVYVKATGIPEEDILRMMREETWLDATEARAKGFIDEITKGNIQMAACVDLSKFQNPPEALVSLAANAAAGRPASIAELKAACVGAPSDFLLQQAEAGATVQAALTAWSTLQADKIRRLEAQATGTKQAAAMGVDTLGSGLSNQTTTTFDDPEIEWHALVAKHEARGLSKQRALSAAVHENPELHRAFLVAYNARFGRTVSDFGHR